MQKPIIFLPFILVYKIVFAIIKVPFNIIKYCSYGLLWSSYFVYSGFKYNIDGFLTCLKLMNVNVKTISEKQKEIKALANNKEQIDNLKNIDFGSLNSDLANMSENLNNLSEIPNMDQETIDKLNKLSNINMTSPSTIGENINNNVVVSSIPEMGDNNFTDDEIKTIKENVEHLQDNNISADEINQLKDNVEQLKDNNISSNEIEQLKENVQSLQDNISELTGNDFTKAAEPAETKEDLSSWEAAFEDDHKDYGPRLSDLLEKSKIKPEELDNSIDLDVEVENKVNNIDYSTIKVTEKELQKLTKDKLKIQATIKKEKELQEKRERLELKEKAKADKKKLNAERKKKLKDKSNDSYVNEKVDIKRPGFFAGFDDIGKKINNIPKLIADKFKNNDFVKHNRNQKMIKKEALLINFEGEDAKKSDVKIPYQYEVKDKDGKYIKGYFEAFSKVEVHSYLLSEGYEVYSIKTNKWIQALYKRSSVNHVKIKIKDLIFFLTQLSTYLKAGIPLVEALRILARQFKNKKYKRIFDEIVYDLTTGENFSEALLKQNVAFPRLLINMIKTSEMTGELPEVLDDMASYYTESEKTRKQMITALMYPSLVLIFAVGVITFIMMFVIPQFVEIYATMDAAQIPTFTLIVIAVSEFIQNYIIWILVGIVLFILLIMYLYNNVKVFRTVCQWILMHLPVIGTTIIYNEVTMFTKTFASLLSHNVFITDSMEVLNKITNNEIYKMLILDTITNLARGDKISTAFEGHWAFPVPAYEMLVTGEKTGELAEMMQKVSDYYQTLHAEQVTRIKTFIEPILTVFLTVVVGIIILAVIIPMFNMYNTVQNY